MNNIIEKYGKGSEFLRKMAIDYLSRECIEDLSSLISRELNIFKITEILLHHTRTYPIVHQRNISNSAEPNISEGNNSIIRVTWFVLEMAQISSGASPDYISVGLLEFFDLDYGILGCIDGLPVL